MADELRATGRVFDIRFSQGFGYRRTHAKLGYGFHDAAGGRHYIWIELNSEFAGAEYGFDGATQSSHPNDPARDIWEAWAMKCPVSGVLIIA